MGNVPVILFPIMLQVADTHGFRLGAFELGPAVDAGDLRENYKDPEQKQGQNGEKNGQEQDREIQDERRDYGNDGDEEGGHIEIVVAQESPGPLGKIIRLPFFGKHFRHDIQT